VNTVSGVRFQELGDTICHRVVTVEVRAYRQDSDAMSLMELSFQALLQRERLWACLVHK
jgi:hypothetical protein